MQGAEAQVHRLELEGLEDVRPAEQHQQERHRGPHGEAEEGVAEAGAASDDRDPSRETGR